MAASASVRFARAAAAIALISGLGTTLAVVARHGAGASWCVSGWLVAAAIGVAGGTWMAATHGRAGATFVLALGVCILTRLVALTVGVLLAMWRDPEAFWPFVLGFAAGYAPLQVFESVWFAKSVRKARAEGPAVTRRTR